MSLELAFASFVSIALLGSACASTPAPSATAATEPPPRALRYDTVLSGTPQNLAVKIHAEVADVCGIPAGKAFFETNSDRLDAQDQTVLVMVAECMTTGKLKGRTILATGFADYTGTYDANNDLGLKRSRAVATELIARGVSADRIFIRSYGERGASYPGDTSVDRKVELRLVDAEEAAL